MKSQYGGKLFVKKIALFLTLLVLTLLAQTGFANPQLPEAEMLFVRRILDFWKDKEYAFAKEQITAYLANYPDGVYINRFYMLLGDIAMEEKGYQLALDHYKKIKDIALQSEVKPKQWQALYQLELYEDLYQELTSLTSEQLGEQGNFFLAETTFRKALEAEKEEAQKLFHEALPLYASLTSSSYEPHVKLAMAEIYRLLGESEEAAERYLELAETTDERREELLYHAAAMLSQYDQPRASTLFERLARSESGVSSMAARQWLTVLAHQEEWKKIAHERDFWLSKLDDAHRSAAYYYLGMIALKEKRHYQAVADLQKALDKGIAPPHECPALEALLSSACELKNLELCDSCYEQLVKTYPEKQAEAGLVRAKAYAEAGETTLALTHLDAISHQSPTSKSAEIAQMEKVRVLMDQKRWDEAHEEAHRFLKANPHSKHKQELLRLSVNLSQMCASEGKLYSQLVEDLERAFKARIYQGEERSEKETLLIKAYLKTGNVHGALGLLHEMENPDPLLFTLAYIQEGNAHEKVVDFGEKALEHDPHNDRLHLHLFNAYLELARESPDNALTGRAAEHLDAIIDVYPVSLENRLWLAHHFAENRDTRTLSLLESLLQTEANWKRFDSEALLLANLHLDEDRPQVALQVAKRVISLDQKTKPEAQLIQAKAYLKLEKAEKAERLFAYLEDLPYPPIAQAASLHVARLRFEREPERSLKRLHHLKVRKILNHEPVHLEAALDHAKLNASLKPQEERTKHYLAALLEVREEFTSEHDICSKDYHESRHRMPEKDAIYHAYMRYLDARIYQLQARLTSNSREKNAKEHAARALYSTLRQGKHALTSYLVEQATAGMHDE